MSCIRFNTPAQRAQLQAAAPRMRTAEELVAAHPAPPVTEGKLRRLRLLADSPDPKIRASVAGGRRTPPDVFERLARDPDPAVRVCVARNETTPCDVLRELARDEVEAVRGWVAVNYFVPADVMDRLADDESPTVRSLVAWKASLAAGDELAEGRVEGAEALA